MRSRLIFCVFAHYVVFGLLSIQANSFKVVDFDLEVGASGKHEEWEKGDESDFYEGDEEKKGFKGEKGYEGEHG